MQYDWHRQDVAAVRRNLCNLLKNKIIGDSWRVFSVEKNWRCFALWAGEQAVTEPGGTRRGRKLLENILHRAFKPVFGPLLLPLVPGLVLFRCRESDGAVVDTPMPLHIEDFHSKDVV
jgi:hypothetical protein